MSSLYRLEALIGPAFYTFEFTAEGDDEARAMVATFAHVAQPFGYGPLNEIGNFKEMGIQTRRDNPRPVPLEIPPPDEWSLVDAAVKAKEIDQWKPKETKSARAKLRRRR